jgi:hypothetical protein
MSVGQVCKCRQFQGRIATSPFSIRGSHGPFFLELFYKATSVVGVGLGGRIVHIRPPLLPIQECRSGCPDPPFVN